jgi:hypothetical protein
VLADAGDADDLCRRLLAAGGRSSSTRHGEAVDLLRRVGGAGERGNARVAMLLCTCSRWRRVTAKLVAAIESEELLSDVELDELAEAFLADELVIEYPLVWMSPEWLEIDLDDPRKVKRVVADERTGGYARARRSIPPPLRRWAGRRALHASPARLDELLSIDQRLDPHARAAMVLGLLDAAAALTPLDRRRLAAVGLESGVGRVRGAALDIACELDGPEVAMRRARSDPDAGVRAWRPSSPTLTLL